MNTLIDLQMAHAVNTDVELNRISTEFDEIETRRQAHIARGNERGERGAFRKMQELQTLWSARYDEIRSELWIKAERDNVNVYDI